MENPPPDGKHRPQPYYFGIIFHVQGTAKYRRPNVPRKELMNIQSVSRFEARYIVILAVYYSASVCPRTCHVKLVFWIACACYIAKKSLKTIQ